MGKHVAKIEQLLKVGLPGGALVEGPDEGLDVVGSPPVLRLARCSSCKHCKQNCMLHRRVRRSHSCMLSTVGTSPLSWRAHSLAGGQRGSYLLGRTRAGIDTDRLCFMRFIMPSRT